MNLVLNKLNLKEIGLDCYNFIHIHYKLYFQIKESLKLNNHFLFLTLYIRIIS